MSINNIYTVTKLNSEIRALLENGFYNLWLSGEISNLTIHSSGHWYFTLKDQGSQIRAAMFRGKNQFCRVKIANGMQVLVHGTVSIYEQSGNYQVIVTSLKDEGAGSLALKYDILKQELNAKGLFATERKRPLPKNIRTVGLITSPTGAAIKDVLHTLKRRDPSIKIIVYPSLVQGETAATDLVEAIIKANQKPMVDLLLLTRGGGTLEDLWCFNDPKLANAIYSSVIPIISAIGHEVDSCISDFVADVRAATPTAGAELVSAHKDDKKQLIVNIKERLNLIFINYLHQQENKIRMLQHKMANLDPKSKLEIKLQKFKNLDKRLNELMQNFLINNQTKLNYLDFRCKRFDPIDEINASKQLLTNMELTLIKSINKTLDNKETEIKIYVGALDNLSPLATLKRGYSINYIQDDLIKKVSQVKVGDELITKLQDGEIRSKVTAIDDI